MSVRQPIEEEYLDVFQNLESVISQYYRQEPDLNDWDVETVVEALIRHYQALWRGQEPRQPRLRTELREALYDNLITICELRLGAAALVDPATDEEFLPFEPISLEELVAILKRIRKSIRFWNKKGGVRGYLTYIDQFFPTAEV